jgi:hypothetical protein
MELRLAGLFRPVLPPSIGRISMIITPSVIAWTHCGPGQGALKQELIRQLRGEPTARIM